MPKLNHIEVVFARKKLTSAEFKNQEQTQPKKIKTAPKNVYSWTENGTNNLECDSWSTTAWKSLVKNLLNQRIDTLTVIKKIQI